MADRTEVLRPVGALWLRISRTAPSLPGSAPGETMSTHANANPARHDGKVLSL